MALITVDEMVRGACIGVFGGLAGVCTVVFPGSAIWLVPAGVAVGGCALTVPEIRQEVIRAIPQTANIRGLLAAPAEAISNIKQRASDMHDRSWSVPMPDDDPPVAPATPKRAQPKPQTHQQAQPRVAVAERPRWLEITNDEPDKFPHALILGGTGAGKTTMAKAIMGDRGGRAVVLAPKVSPKGWVGSGAEVITLDDDCTYAPIVQALQDIDEEKRRRSGMIKRGVTPEPLTIVLDDIQDLTVMEPATGQLMVNLSSIGRELNMRLIGIGTTDDALNIRGWKASRNNYVRIETNEERRGVMTAGTRTINIQAQESKRLADAAKLTPWRGTAQLPLPEPEPVPRAVVSSDDELLRSLFESMTPDRAARLKAATGQQVIVEREGGDVVVNVHQVVSQPAKRTKDEARTRILQATYRAAGAEGMKFDEVYAEHKGTKADVFPAWQEGKRLHDEKSRS